MSDPLSPEELALRDRDLKVKEGSLQLQKDDMQLKRDVEARAVNAASDEKVFREREQARQDEELKLKRRDSASKRGELALKAKEFRSTRWRNAFVVGVLTALITAWASLSVAWNNAQASRDLEAQKWGQAQFDERLRLANAAMTAHASESSRCLQAESQLMRSAIEEPQNFGRKQLVESRAVCRDALPKAYSAVAQLGLYSSQAHNDLNPTLKETFGLQRDLDRFASEHIKGTAKARSEFEARFRQVDAQLGLLADAMMNATQHAQKQIKDEVNSRPAPAEDTSSTWRWSASLSSIANTFMRFMERLHLVEMRTATVPRVPPQSQQGPGTEPSENPSLQAPQGPALQGV